ncbi:sigma-70 family RNA polymerase sigma factor [Polaribacter batillariae]|uniref:Sigma-70 family RNA polymerase sigma factor n=1 Tax=Polaribacter batillariae TaxID=2808900 RepID=A0ABX7SU11_9FLAO|nr:sigma-70 family RNA polymerase sigma factor [Polaribacter batillariae]QTD36451.1 sigma-70 family RNA polymerase sigma factor [Polaribacter batillariae]
MTFKEIWDKHKSHLLNFIKTKMDDENIAEDVLQEVNLKLIENLNRKTEIKNYKTWIFQVARNTIADYYRKNKRYSELPINESEITNSSTCFCDLTGFVIQTYLPEKYSRPLFLSDIEQKPQQEIAEILNLSLTATKSRIQRGRKKLKELVNKCIDISYNNKGQVSDFQLKNNCELPQELKNEMARINFIP